MNTVLKTIIIVFVFSTFWFCNSKKGNRPYGDEAQQITFLIKTDSWNQFYKELSAFHLPHFKYKKMEGNTFQFSFLAYFDSVSNKDFFRLNSFISQETFPVRNLKGISPKIKQEVQKLVIIDTNQYNINWNEYIGDFKKRDTVLVMSLLKQDSTIIHIPKNIRFKWCYMADNNTYRLFLVNENKFSFSNDNVTFFSTSSRTKWISIDDEDITKDTEFKKKQIAVLKISLDKEGAKDFLIFSERNIGDIVIFSINENAFLPITINMQIENGKIDITIHKKENLRSFFELALFSKLNINYKVLDFKTKSVKIDEN